MSTPKPGTKKHEQLRQRYYKLAVEAGHLDNIAFIKGDRPRDKGRIIKNMDKQVELYKAIKKHCKKYKLKPKLLKGVFGMFGKFYI